MPQCIFRGNAKHFTSLKPSFSSRNHVHATTKPVVATNAKYSKRSHCTVSDDVLGHKGVCRKTGNRKKGIGDRSDTSDQYRALSLLNRPQRERIMGATAWQPIQFLREYGLLAVNFDLNVVVQVAGIVTAAVKTNITSLHTFGIQQTTL